MRCADIYVSGTGAYLPDSMPVGDAVSMGAISRETAEKSGIAAACVFADDGRPPEDMAVTAATEALAYSWETNIISRLFHATGFDGAAEHCWNQHAYIENALGLRGSTSVGIRGLCNAGMLAVESAAHYLLAGGKEGTGNDALVVTSDWWPEPIVNRWHAMPGHALGDGGSAVVLTRDPRRARAQLLSVVTRSEPSLEKMIRGDSFAPGNGKPIDLRERTRNFLREMPREEASVRRDAGLTSAVSAALSDADVAAGDIDHVALSFLGRDLFDREFNVPLMSLGVQRSQTRRIWELGNWIGHLGAGDPLVALHDLVAFSGQPRAETILIVGVGGGYSWTAAVLRTVKPEREGHRCR